MLTLILLRHAKAIQSAGHDFARDLTPAGRATAGRVGADLVDRGLVPDLAVVSPAARTRQTFGAVEAACGRSIASRFVDALYNATDRQIHDCVNRLDRQANRVMMVGHNPGIMDCALGLASRGSVADLARLRDRFPPCAYAVLTFETDCWADVVPEGGCLDLFALPEDLAARD